jgi:hypothetical protein
VFVPESSTTIREVAREGVFCTFHMADGYEARGTISAVHPDGWFEVSTNKQLYNGAQVVRVESSKRSATTGAPDFRSDLR